VTTAIGNNAFGFAMRMDGQNIVVAGETMNHLLDEIAVARYMS